MSPSFPMPIPAPLLHEYASLPLHAQLMLAIVAGSVLLCLALPLTAVLLRCCRREQMAPASPEGFPFACDQIFTLLFMGFILWGAASSLLPAQEEPAKASVPFGWGALLLGVAAQLGLYLPLLVRYGMLHPWQPPARPWWHYLVLPLLVWALIYLSVILLETSGFTPWLVRETGCPEHQSLVLTFSRGEPLQRLYIILCAVFVAPVVEECCFRGFLYSTLRRWGGCVAATIASALLFGAIHASLAQMLPLTLFGIAQCIAYEKVRSLWLPIAVHMLFNTTSLIATALLHP